MESIKIAILEDHSVVTEGIISILKSNPFFSLAGEFRTAADLFHFLESNPIDVLVLDIDLPDRNGIDVLREIKEKHQPTKVIIFSLHGSRVYVEDAIKAKADGYMLKSDPISKLPEVISLVMKGGSFISEGVSKVQLPFSAFQMEILNLLVQGLSQNEVADRIQKSRKTVEYHLNQMRTKFSCKNNNELISKYEKEIQK
ncbi:DNA-binding response regulator [Leptospira bourretii]|uniref:DNA-binding response regulator n=1 Tax=Leptospira bourretii TaxID=2484962 RepID=A0A4R9INM3_9LEPT|nr:response regulator transcription factor [Leptospira bourretii]MCG6140336.1 response regulator transcription factor [Leptospira mtsangambouensis]TGK89358.1 DNA-binding response regulator [Leptospira bourretii]TGK93474.1 DNA-binding response regulator [Leptospira bourretii]TGL18407.1 DNA-binding response regulator [Leptospira bourretii]TGL39944.1 DNA-binding response regulator [Leptospira bourretii]